MGVTVQFEVPGAENPGERVTLQATAVVVPNEMKQFVEGAYAYVDASKAAAKASEIAAEATAASYAIEMAKMATSVINTQTLIVQLHN